MKVSLIKQIARATAVALALVALSVDEGQLATGEVTIAKAQAVRGRPATPVSYAGVARRTTRRAMVVGAASTHTCVQKVDAYGRVVTVCN
jgi:hypothetical protein